jgi:hypothetical protein
MFKDLCTYEALRIFVNVLYLTSSVYFHIIVHHIHIRLFYIKIMVVGYVTPCSFVNIYTNAVSVVRKRQVLHVLASYLKLTFHCVLPSSKMIYEH